MTQFIGSDALETAAKLLEGGIDLHIAHRSGYPSAVG